MESTDERQSSAEQLSALRCVHHRGTETYLRCGKCGEPICARCVVITPVGARCVACARPRRLPTFEVTPIYYVRAVGAALGAALVAGSIAGLLRLGSPVAGLLLTLALGYLVGEAVALAVNRKRGGGLKVVAGAGVIAAVVCQQLVGILVRMPALLSLEGVGAISAASLLNLLGSPLALVAVALGILVAASRL